jgi:hypothetical protein
MKFYSHHWWLVSSTPGVISLTVLPSGHPGKGVEFICRARVPRGGLLTANCGLWKGLGLAILTWQSFYFSRHEGSNLRKEILHTYLAGP